MKLYELAADLSTAIEQYNSVETDEQLAELEKTLADLSLSFNDKAVGVALHVLGTEATVSAIEMEIGRLVVLRDRNQKQADWFREYLKRNMEATGTDKIDGGKVVLKIRKNPASVIVEDETAIPREYIKTKTVESIDKAAIKESWARGVGVAGTKVENKTRLEVK